MSDLVQLMPTSRRMKESKKKSSPIRALTVLFVFSALALTASIWGINFSISPSGCAQDGYLSNILDEAKTWGASNKITRKTFGERNNLTPDFPSRQVAQDHLLTIAVDRYHSCPDECRFVHVLLPPWVRFRYIHFQDETDLAVSDDSTTHLLILARTNIIKLGSYVAERKKKNNMSVGLYHMADERIHGGEINGIYHKFDYVLRNYYSDAKPFYGMFLRALGNHSCGESKKLPTSRPYEPRWGTHWLHLDSHSMAVDMQRSGASSWPTSKRPVNCSFIGRDDVKRSVKERGQMKQAMEEIPELNCTVQFTAGFAKGNSPFTYFNRDLGTAKIGLCPRGSAVETHRLSEVLRMGLAPALKDAPYLHAAFRKLPGIIGENWTVVAEKMKWYLTEAPDELEKLAENAAQFSEDLNKCVKQDMNIILQSAFRIRKKTPLPFRLVNST
jgi:hypothetical protein